MQHLRSPSLYRPRNPQIWSVSAQIYTPGARALSRSLIHFAISPRQAESSFYMEMKSDNGSVRVAFNPAPVPPVTCAAKALAALLVSALAKTHLVAVDQFGLLVGGRPINRGGHSTHVDQPEPFDVDCSGERNGSGGDAPTEKLPSKDDEPKKEQGEPDANGEGEDSEDQADADDADQGDAPEDGGDEDDDDDDGEDDAEDGGDDDDDNEDDDEDDNGPNAEDVEGGQEEESGADEEDEDEEELQPPKKRKK